MAQMSCSEQVQVSKLEAVKHVGIAYLRQIILAFANYYLKFKCAHLFENFKIFFGTFRRRYRIKQRSSLVNPTNVTKFHFFRIKAKRVYISRQRTMSLNQKKNSDIIHLPREETQNTERMFISGPSRRQCFKRDFVNVIVLVAYFVQRMHMNYCTFWCTVAPEMLLLMMMMICMIVRHVTHSLTHCCA